MEILEERFRSRFEWGLIADITLPDYETRMAILHKKEELDGYNISEEVIKYIACLLYTSHFHQFVRIPLQIKMLRIIQGSFYICNMMKKLCPDFPDHPEN